VDQDIKELIKKANKIITNSYVAAVGGGSDDEVAVFRAPCAGKIIEIGVIPDAAVTGDDTDNFTMSCENKGAAGIGTDEICSLELATGVDLVALDYQSLGDVDNVDLDKDDTVTFIKTEANSGLAMPAMVVVVEFQPQWEAWKP